MKALNSSLDLTRVLQPNSPTKSVHSKSPMLTTYDTVCISRFIEYGTILSLS